MIEAVWRMVREGAVSDKATCPACETTTSSVLSAFRRGDPCPCCGLSAEAAGELVAARRRGADADLVRRAAQAEQRAETAEAEMYRLRRLLRQVGELAGEVEAGR